MLQAAAAKTNSDARPRAAILAGQATTRFEWLLDRHKDRVYGYVRSYLGNDEDARDVVQDVFIRLWHNMETLEDERAAGWLLRVARNACIDLLRSRRSSRLVFSGLESDFEQVWDGEPGPDTLFETLEFEANLQHALGRMNEPYRSILILREIQDMKYEDISEAMGLPLNTLKVYLHRARKALRHQLAERIESETP